MFRFAVISLSAALLVSACGTKTKLTAEQKQELAATMESAGRAQKVAKNLTGNGRFAVLDPRNSLTAEQKMLQKLQLSTCTHKVIEPKPTGGFSDPLQQGFSVEGTGCPIAMSFVITTALTGHTSWMKMDMSYLVNDPQYRSWNDIYAMKLAGRITGEKSSGSGELRGSMRSQKYGEIPLALTVSGGESHAEMVWTLTFPTFVVELKISGSPQSGSIQYSLNGEDLSPSEFQALIAKGGDAFASGTQNPTRN